MSHPKEKRENREVSARRWRLILLPLWAAWCILAWVADGKDRWTGSLRRP